MINLSLAPTPSLPKTINSAMPAAVPPQIEDGIFARSLDRMQAPRTPAPPPESKVKIDNADAPGKDGDAEVESKRALDALSAMQRTAAARQATLRNAAQTAQAAEAAKADRAAREIAKGAPLPEPAAPPTAVPSEPVVCSDCEYHPDTTPTDDPGIALPPTILPVELPQPKHTLPIALPPAGVGDGAQPGLPPRSPPITEDETSDPRLSGQPPAAAPPIKGDFIANLPNAPVRPGPSAGAPQSARDGDRPEPAARAEERKAKGLQPVATGPSAPLVPADPANQATRPSTLPMLLPGSNNLRGSIEAMPNPNPSAQNAAAALAAMLPGADPLRAEAPLSAPLSARPGSSAFADQLGAQVAVWAKDGVQRASLQLNPLELGPVSVQIRLDGNGAQVSLAADLAATRLALEQALPSLASSLREAGLTLTGGGVFDQARQQAGTEGNGNGNNPAADARRTLPALEAERAQRVTTTAPRSRGVVDLMA